MKITTGNKVRIEASIRDISGELADPTTVTVKVRKPSGAVLTISPDRVSTGIYRSEVAVDEGGQWCYRIEGTGAVTTATEGSFPVAMPITNFNP